jgi:hypothetical protein
MAPAATQSSSKPETRFAPVKVIRSPKKRTATLAWFVVVAGVAIAYLYTSLFSLAGTPHLRSGDEDFFWTYGSRLLSGQLFLRDFHQFTPPGADLVYAAVFRWFGASVRTIDWTILSLGLAIAVTCFWCARRIMRAEMAALAALTSVVLLYGDRMDATHHWFSSLANLLAILVLMRGSSWYRIALAGGLVALAAFFTQTAGAVGPLACISGLWWEKRISRASSQKLRTQIVLLAGVTTCVWLLLSWHFIANAGLGKYWSEQVLYLPRDANFPAGFLVPRFTAYLHMRSLIALVDHFAVYLMLIAVCPWAGSLCFRRKLHGNENSVAVFLLAALGVFQTLVVIAALNWNRMAAVAMPAVILGVWMLARIGPRGKRYANACWCALAAMMLVQSGATQFRRYPLVKLPAGAALVAWDDLEEVAWLAGHTRPGDDFFEAGNTRLYVPLELRNPATVDVLAASNWTPPERVKEAVQGLDASRTRYILWEPHTGLGLVEDRHRSADDHLDPLRAYIEAKYARVAAFANGDQMWERRY